MSVLLEMAASAWVLSMLLLVWIVQWATKHACSPQVRIERTLWAASVPWLLPVAAISGFFLVAAGKQAGLLDDHCIQHADGHAHWCFEHIGAVSEYSGAAFLVALIAIGAGWSMYRFVAQASNAANSFSTLFSIGRGGRKVRVLPHAAPVALASGVRDPRIVVSSGLLRRLTTSERRIVMAHEVAHLRAGDTRMGAVLRLLLAIHLPWSRSRLVSTWVDAVEDRADDRVADRFGSEKLAAVLMKLMGATVPGDAIGLSAFGGNPAQRVRRLLGQGEAVPITGSPTFVGLTCTCVLIVLTFSAHHWIETAMGWLW